QYMTNEYIEYNDAILKMQMPAYLRQQKGLRYFKADRRRNKNPEIFGITIDILNDEEAVAECRSNLSTVNFIEWEGVRMSCVRRGETEFVEKGYECLDTSTLIKTNTMIIIK